MTTNNCPTCGGSGTVTQRISLGACLVRDCEEDHVVNRTRGCPTCLGRGVPV